MPSFILWPSGAEWFYPEVVADWPGAELGVMVAGFIVAAELIVV